MRIIAGEKRGTKLLAPQGLDTRPTLDRVKEAVFGRLQFELQEKQVLDLFAGSGALGLEAVSRGAREAVFVDNDAASQEAIRKNIQAAGCAHKATIVEKDFEAAIKLFQNQKKFDIVLLDPPYESGYYEKAFKMMAQYEVLAQNAVIVAESSGPLVVEEGGFALEKQKRYGKVFVSFFRWKGK